MIFHQILSTNSSRKCMKISLEIFQVDMHRLRGMESCNLALHIWLHGLLNRKWLGTIEALLWYTSIQGTQNLVTEKCSHNVCICYLYWRETSIQGNWTLFWVLKPKFNFHSEDTLVLKTSLTTKRVDKLSVHSLCHTSRRTALARIQYHRDKLPWLFGHYLAAWNNDCNRFQGRIKQILLVYY